MSCDSFYTGKCNSRSLWNAWAWMWPLNLKTVMRNEIGIVIKNVLKNVEMDTTWHVLYLSDTWDCAHNILVDECSRSLFSSNISRNFYFWEFIYLSKINSICNANLCRVAGPAAFHHLVWGSLWICGSTFSWAVFWVVLPQTRSSRHKVPGAFFRTSSFVPISKMIETQTTRSSEN